MTSKTIQAFTALGLSLVLAPCARAARLASVRVVDEKYLMIHWEDGTVDFIDEPTGPKAFQGHSNYTAEKLRRFDPPLDVVAAGAVGSYTVTSTDDPAYAAGILPSSVSRRAKVNGTTSEWPEPPFTMEHQVYLRLPKPLLPGKHYKITFQNAVHSDQGSATVVFDPEKTESEAIHTNIVAVEPGQPVAADLYMWLGDAGARDYRPNEGREVYVVDAKTGVKAVAGKVAFGKKRGPDFGKWDATASDVWHVDFTSPKALGKYRLMVPGIGSSPVFEVRPDAYASAFKTSLLGFFFMRIGESKDFKPVPRQPRFIPNVDPPGYKVYLTSFSPKHPDWQKMQGDVWDVRDWSKYKLPGNPTNPNAYGGHSDAMDWDRHAGHVSNIYDILLPYLLSNGRLKSDDTGIRESGNGIPDVIDEAQNEVDFWLRLRDQNGDYSFGLNNPDDKMDVMYQAASAPFMAWVNAANAAMLADAYRLAKKSVQMAKYRDAALEAWRRAKGQDLDFSYGVGNGAMRGRDFKMLAAACLYNVTGDRKFEDAMVEESVVKDAVTELDNTRYCQYWGAAAYLICSLWKVQAIHYPEVVANMQAAITREAETKNLSHVAEWPTRRASDTAYGWFQTTTAVTPLLIAHAVSGNPAKKAEYLRAMKLEADYGLGRNPLNMVLMTGLGSRHADVIYTSGRNDGFPGNHPGHTPYMNADTWSPGYMGDPQWYATKGYPEWKQWPHGEALWRAPYCYSNSEFTPQQTMRGKTALLGYLYSLELPK